MQLLSRRCRIAAGIAFAVSLSVVAPASTQELPTAPPADVGLSEEKLAQVDRVVDNLVENNRLAGGVVMIVRKGKVAKLQPYGMMDIEAQKPMTNDAIFRIYSMTVTVQSVGWFWFFVGRGGMFPVFEYSLNAARSVSRGWWLRSLKVRKTDISTDWVRAPRSLWLQ